MSNTSPTYELWRRGNGRASRPEAWQLVSQLEALSAMKEAFHQNLGRYAYRHPEVPIDATAVWWGYLHQPDCETIDLIRLRIRRRPPP